MQTAHLGADGVGASDPTRKDACELVVIDLDDEAGRPYLAGDEARAIAWARERGFRIAVATSRSKAEAERILRGKLGEITVISDDDVRVAGRIDRAHALAALCRELGWDLAGVIVIASSPADLPLALEAGRVIALEDAGRACRAIAKTVVAERSNGGIIEAIRALDRENFETTAPRTA